jgi:hypothetical protein
MREKNGRHLAMIAKKKSEPKITELPCGCKYQDDGFLVVRIRECSYHQQRRTKKRPYRPKAECVRP